MFQMPWLHGPSKEVVYLEADPAFGPLGECWQWTETSITRGRATVLRPEELANRSKQWRRVAKTNSSVFNDFVSR